MRLQILCMCVALMFVTTNAKQVRIQQSDVTQQALPIYVGWVGEKTEEQERLCERFMTCLRYSGQFAPSCEWLACMPTVRSKLREIFHNGYMIAVFIGCNNNTLGWRLYDVADGHMITGASFPACSHERLWVYSAAESLWRALTKQEAPFVSHMTYVKQVTQHNRTMYNICVADFDGSYERVVYASPRYLMSPQWGWIDGYPVIFYSEFTPHNVRIGVTDTAGNARTLFNFDGTTVGFVQCSHEVIYCRSGMIWGCHHDASRGKRVHAPIVREAGACASPTVDESGNIFYCHGGMIKHFNRKEGIGKPVLYQGYYVAPSYHIEQRELVYAQRVNGVIQLGIYSCDTKKKRQITHDHGDKYDPRWSPCGQYIIYTNSDDTSVYTYHIPTGTQYRVTSSQDVCMFPTWSPKHVYIV